MVFRLVLVYLPQFHASDPLNGHLVDLATDLWNITIAIGRSSAMSLSSTISVNDSFQCLIVQYVLHDVFAVVRDNVRLVLRVQRSEDMDDQLFQL